jgi:NADH:ubiquinone oxidoreductase subunit 5 (subunit L)/multisubunit Na+/H+ antiporter MnhA subunit
MLPTILALAPFALTLLYALLVPNGKNRHVGYVGALASAATLWLLFAVGQSQHMRWFSAANVSFALALGVDPITLVFGGIVAGAGIFVFLYSVGYFEPGEDLRRYYALLSLFALSMLGAVLARDLFLLFFWWELVGVSSFLLIGFWHGRDEAVRAARKAILTILVGDVLFLGGVLALALRYGTLSIDALVQLARPDTITLAAMVGILAGALSKSAQFPFHAWLPDAMAGPTPVSAFLHSAAMVKAGLYLVARFLPVFLLVGLGPWIMAIALLSIVLSALCALVETDVKRVLAYSTMNHLGIILLALGAGALGVALVHVLVHSAFKALLFFSAGIAIHSSGTQDLRGMRLAFGANALAVTTLIGVLSLAGLPPLAGFFSKEGILSALAGEYGMWVAMPLMAALFIGALYGLRWYMLLFRRGGKQAHAPWQMRAPLVPLALACALGGIAAAPLAAWLGDAGAHTDVALAISSTLLVLAAVAVALGVFVRGWSVRWLERSVLAQAMRERFLVDSLYDAIARKIARIAHAISRIDNLVVNRGVRLVGEWFVAAGNALRRIHTGAPAAYVAGVLAGFAALVILLGVLS